MRTRKPRVPALLILALSASAVMAIEFEIVGPGNGSQDVSANGATVLLFDYGTSNAYLWTAEDGLALIGTGDASSPFWEISWDGKSVLGTMEHDAAWQASVWTEGEGWQGLGAFPVDNCAQTQLSTGWGISADGSVAVGLGWLRTDGNCWARAFRWSEATGMVPLQVTNAQRQSRASAVSGDGRVAVGWTETDLGTWRPTYWDVDGMEHLIDPDPEWFSEALHVNADGSVVVGQLEQHAFRWTQTDGAVDLGTVPGSPGSSRAVGVSADGNTIVGWGGTPPFDLRAFVWTPGGGMQSLHDIVINAGYDIGNWIVSHATAISADGTVIVGALANPANYTYQAYRLILAPPRIPPIPNGQDPQEGQPLLLERLPAGDLRLSWSPTCMQSETDYAVYRGTLGDFYSHTRARCSTEGLPEITVRPSAESSYYLVVPIGRDHEASYGTDSAGIQRPAGVTTCAAGQTSGSCAW